MDLKSYYQKIRETAASMPEADVVVTSIESADGGKAGQYTEVPKQIAAKLIVEGRARLATPQESSEFRARQAEAKRAAEKAAEASRVQMTMLPQSIVDRLRIRDSKE